MDDGPLFHHYRFITFFPLKACFELQLEYQKFNKIKRYLLQVESRPAFQTALMKGQ